jgi:hypothetical protein
VRGPLGLATRADLERARREQVNRLAQSVDAIEVGAPKALPDGGDAFEQALLSFLAHLAAKPPV